MNFVIVSAACLAVLAFLCPEAESFFTPSVTPLAVSIEATELLRELLAAAIGIKALTGLGFLIARGSRSRFTRSTVSVEDIPFLINEAALEDKGDCAKKFVCEVHSKDFASLDKTELGIYMLFGTGEVIDVSKDSVQFDLAALIGRKAGFAQCQKVYARCNASNNQLKSALMQ